MIYAKLYKYDSTKADYKGEDFSKYILLAPETTEDLQEILDVADLTLVGLPTSKEFEPSTKFIFEIWDDLVTDAPVKSFHLCVAQDLVSQPILSDDNYFNHNISFDEASVIAQNRLVDNIAVTYRLQEVSLSGKMQFDPNQKAEVSIKNINKKEISDPFQSSIKSLVSVFHNGRRFNWEFPNWFASGSTNNSSIDEWKNFAYYQGTKTTKEVTLPIPMLRVDTSVQNSNDYVKQGYCSVRVDVIETDLASGEQINVQGYPIVVNPCTSNEHENEWLQSWESEKAIINATTPCPALNKGEILTRIKVRQSGSVGVNGLTDLYVKTIAKYDTNPTNRRITFTIKPNKQYPVRVSLANLKGRDSDGYIKDDTENARYENAAFYTGFIAWKGTNYDNFPTNTDNLSASISFKCLQEDETNRILLHQAPQETAYDLYNKSQLTVQNVAKEQGTPITETKQAFYLNDDDAKELKNTVIVENFYNQKNLWEIQLDIGKYIHAVPKTRFGADDRLVTSFKRLGMPPADAEEIQSNKISIYNSKSIENYISACSSYVSNMVQLGGVINEWVAPKSSSEDYLVYNDVAEIITSKNIIEIVNMEVKRISDGTIRNLAGKGTNGENSNGYIFEKNIYDLLPIDGRLRTNKGLAIYYELGGNTIKGLNYQLPSVSRGDATSEYAIKRIIADAFKTDESGLPYVQSSIAKIKVNDYVFHIVYRTKDTLRSDQTRPDLRKYMLNSKYDRVPLHNQFNNQQDIVVDSVKFGNNIYGKLIRTGNTEYTITEWLPNSLQIRNTGEVYKIKGDIYYVTRVKNTYYKDHIVSEVTFSKDYNQLSEIIGIPSEPRFYEISEQSIIKREVSINDYIVLRTADSNQLPIYYNQGQLSFTTRNSWDYLCQLLLRTQVSRFPFSGEFPKYAITIFKNDQERKYGDVLGNETFYKEVCHPINAYSTQNTLTFEWDMVDNFSAGDEVSPTIYEYEKGKTTTDKDYRTLQPVQYTDAFGRSDLFDFLIMFDIPDLTADQIMNLPNSPLRTRFPNYTTYIGKLTTKSVDVSVPATDAQLTDFVVKQQGRQPQDGDGIINEVNISSSVSADQTSEDYYFCVYENSAWTKTLTYDPNEYSKPYITTQKDNYLFGNETIERTWAPGSGYQDPTIGDNLHGLALLKDNREQISMNYNIQMVTDSDRLVVSSYVWQPNKQNIRLVLLNDEINKISTGLINKNTIIEGKSFKLNANLINPPTNVETSDDYILIKVSEILANEDLTGVSAIAVIDDTEFKEPELSGSRYYVFGRNISDLTVPKKEIETQEEYDTRIAEAKKDWWLFSLNKREILNNVQ